MNALNLRSIAAVAWLFALSTILSAILWLGLRVARAKNRAAARAGCFFDLP